VLVLDQIRVSRVDCSCSRTPRVHRPPSPDHRHLNTCGYVSLTRTRFDLYRLTSILYPHTALLEPDETWEVDLLLTDVAAQMQDEQVCWVCVCILCV
jgi:hypothetical protein